MLVYISISGVVSYPKLLRTDVSRYNLGKDSKKKQLRTHIDPLRFKHCNENNTDILAIKAHYTVCISHLRLM